MMTFADRLEQAKQRDSYWAEHSKIDFAIDLERLMDRQNLRKSDLAARMETSPAYISKVLRGDANLTIESMVRLVRAAGGTLHIHIAPQAAKVRWFDILARKQEQEPAIELMALSWANAARKPGYGHLPLAA